MSNSIFLKLSGHLKIWEIPNNGKPNLVFDRHNLIVNEGKGSIMDWFSGVSAGDLGYSPAPLNAMILTKNTSAEDADDTFASAVYGGVNYISDEGVLHATASGHVSITHTTGSSLISISGTIPQIQGNNVTNNHINSVCLVMGASDTTGGRDGESPFNPEPAYTPTGNESLFARVNVGDLIKTNEKVYTFEWEIQVQTSS